MVSGSRFREEIQIKIDSIRERERFHPKDDASSGTPGACVPDPFTFLTRSRFSGNGTVTQAQTFTFTGRLLKIQCFLMILSQY